jgi:hypothetical protein
LVDFRIHQFVRCIEGFIRPRRGKTKQDFQHRTKLFIGNDYSDQIGEIYEVRSKAEHLHDIYADYKSLSKTAQFEKIFRMAFEAQALASYCIVQLLENKNIWSYFLDDDSILEFWQLDQGEQQKLWGKTLNFGEVIQSFESDEITAQAAWQVEDAI